MRFVLAAYTKCKREEHMNRTMPSALMLIWQVHILKEFRYCAFEEKILESNCKVAD